MPFGLQWKAACNEKRFVSGDHNSDPRMFVRRSLGKSQCVKWDRFLPINQMLLRGMEERFRGIALKQARHFI